MKYAHPFQSGPITTAIAIALIGTVPVSGADGDWACTIYPSERETMTESASGATVVMATTHPGNDRGLYFHDRSWLSDESMVLFYSNRTGRNELFGYLEVSGRLVRLMPDGKSMPGGVTCSRRADRVFAVLDNTVVAMTISVVDGSESRVRVRQQVITDLPPHHGLTSSLSENSDGTYLALSYADVKHAGTYHLATIEIVTGKVVVMTTTDYPISHVQFSWSRPNLLMFARTYPDGDRMPTTASAPAEVPHCRIWQVTTGGGQPHPVYIQSPGELVTHECWWTEDRFTFCGGDHMPEESHVKAYDARSGRISIIGAGSWWPEGTPEQITRRAWWHAAGSPDGRRVVADNAHGDIVVFDAFTTLERVLTAGHRRFGSGADHAHPGWAPSSDRIVFTSTRRGDSNLAIVHLPKNGR